MVTGGRDALRQGVRPLLVCVLEVAPRYTITFCKAESWYFCFVLWKPRHRVAFMILIDVWEAAP